MKYQFEQHLQGDKRLAAFTFIADTLTAQKGNTTVVETGSVRIIGNWRGDGQSTRIWNEIADIVVSIDINHMSETIINKLGLSKVTFINENSLNVLGNIPAIEQCNLLYLDSRDYEGKDKALSELHHAAELCLCYERLPSGALIAVDDCHSDTAGKHVLVKTFFDRIGIVPEVSGYVTVWRKP